MQAKGQFAEMSLPVTSGASSAAAAVQPSASDMSALVGVAEGLRQLFSSISSKLKVGTCHASYCIFNVR